MKPYVYMATGHSRDVQRNAPTGGRAAFHFPDLGRSIELGVGEHGHWTVLDMPAPGQDGPSVLAAFGQLAEHTPDIAALRVAFYQARTLADGEAIDACSLLLDAVAAFLDVKEA